jgi:hypothetical protein
MDRLVITIHPTPSDEGWLRVADAMQQVIDALRILEQAERTLVSPQESFEWRLERASAGSPFMVVAVAEPINPAIDVTPHVMRVKAEVSQGLRDFNWPRNPAAMDGLGRDVGFSQSSLAQSKWSWSHRY